MSDMTNKKNKIEKKREIQENIEKGRIELNELIPTGDMERIYRQSVKVDKMMEEYIALEEAPV